MISMIKPRSYWRYVSLPILGPIADEFVTWTHQRGYAFASLVYQLKEMRQLVGLFHQSGVRNLTELNHGQFEAVWRYCRQYRPQTCGTIRQIELFMEETGRLTPHSLELVTPMTLEVNYFADYLRNVRGLESATIKTHVWHLRRFLKYLRYDLDIGVLMALTTKEVDSFLCDCGKRFNRYTLQKVVVSLRTFLKYRYERGTLSKPLHAMIDTPRIYRFERLPRSLPWETVSALLRSVDRTDISGLCHSVPHGHIRASKQRNFFPHP